MAFNYNHVTLVGRVTKHPEFVHVKDRFSKLSFVVAVSRRFNRSGVTDSDFIPITLFGKVAHIGERLLEKGSPILVWGRLQVRTYEKNNERRWMTEVIGENFQVLQYPSLYLKDQVQQVVAVESADYEFEDL